MERIASVPTAKTSLWWDIDYCGVPGGNSVAEDIKSALSNLGYSGAVSIFIYGSNIPESVQRAAGISFNHVTPENRNRKVLVDLTRWVINCPPPANILLLFGVNDFSKEVVDLLFNKGYKIRLARPIIVPPARKTVGFYTDLLRGGGLELEEYMAEAHAKYKVARERIYKSSITSVWWDMMTCKPPLGCDLHDVANNICSALFNIDYCGAVSIFAYGDTDPKPDSALLTPDHSNCILVNHVSEHDINEVLLGDMMQWVLLNPAPANVLLVSSDTHLADALEGSEYNVIFALPSNPTPCYPAGKTVWISSDLLAGGCPIVIDAEKMPTLDAQYKALNKKYKAARTLVWWDVENCRIPLHPKDLNGSKIIHNIESALLHLGYNAPISFNICGKLSSRLSKTDLKQLKDSGVKLIDVDAPEALNEAGAVTGGAVTEPPKKAPIFFGKKDTADRAKMLEMDWVCKPEVPASSNLLLISGDGDFCPTLTKLRRERRANILLAVQEDGANGDLMAAARTLWDWSTLATGGSPKRQGISLDFLVDVEDDEAEDGDSNAKDDDQRTQIKEDTNQLLLHTESVVIGMGSTSAVSGSPLKNHVSPSQAGSPQNYGDGPTTSSISGPSMSMLEPIGQTHPGASVAIGATVPQHLVPPGARVSIRATVPIRATVRQHLVSQPSLPYIRSCPPLYRNSAGNFCFPPRSPFCFYTPEQPRPQQHQPSQNQPPQHQLPQTHPGATVRLHLVHPFSQATLRNIGNFRIPLRNPADYYSQQQLQRHQPPQQHQPQMQNAREGSLGGAALKDNNNHAKSTDPAATMANNY